MAAPSSGLLTRALVWLKDNPDSSAKTIAKAIGISDDRLMYALLKKAEGRGECQRWQHGSGVWLWQETL